MKKAFAVVLALSLTASNVCFAFGAERESESEVISEADLSDDELAFDSDVWQYDSSYDVYYQTGVVYCSEPYDTSYESFGIYVPGDYMTMTKNSDGTYSFEGFTDTAVGEYTAETAPILYP
ncbi:MAG: hypothetical protein LUC97_08210 [Clostridiales bacterium]|nr:hypothetical protein [Clostridiales bacterium]